MQSPKYQKGCRDSKSKRMEEYTKNVPSVIQIHVFTFASARTIHEKDVFSSTELWLKSTKQGRKIHPCVKKTWQLQFPSFLDGKLMKTNQCLGWHCGKDRKTRQFPPAMQLLFIQLRWGTGGDVSFRHLWHHFSFHDLRNFISETPKVEALGRIRISLDIWTMYYLPSGQHATRMCTFFSYKNTTWFGKITAMKTFSKCEYRDSFVCVAFHWETCRRLNKELALFCG